MKTYHKNVIFAYNKGYRVDDEGNVISPFSGKALSLYANNKNKEYNVAYYNFSLRNSDKKSINMAVHWLMAYQKYKDEIFDDKIQIRHLDGNSLNNIPSNIAIGSHSDNAFDKSPEVRMRVAVNASSANRKFSDEIIAEIKYKKKNGHTYAMLMDEYNISSKGTLHYMLKTDYVTAK